MASRDLAHLHRNFRPKVEKFLAAAAEAGLDLLVTCTYRSGAEQAEEYAKGRTQDQLNAVGLFQVKARPDLPKITNARPGQSRHNNVLDDGSPAALAVDVVPLVNGRPVWSTTGDAGKLWLAAGQLGEACGLEWGGRWKFKDYPHFQETQA